MNNGRLILRFMRRDWRNRELRLMLLALVVAVAAVTAVGFFTSRVEQAMLLQANQVLAADLVLASNNPIPDRYTRLAGQLGLETAQTLSFPSVVVHGERTQLVEVKAVSGAYPLRGDLRTRADPAAAEVAATAPPKPGEIWGEARLLAALGLTPGGTLSLGEARFQLTQILSRDAALGDRFFRLGPAVLIALESIPDTGLVTPASRVRHRLLIAGEAQQVDRFRQQVAGSLPAGIRLEHISSTRPELRTALDRGSRFLSLAALVTVLVAGATIALSTRQFVERQSDTSAILRCLGASRRRILFILLSRLLLLGLAASLLGSALGAIAQQVLSDMLSRWFDADLPLPSLAPLLSGLATGLITLVGFVFPSALRLGGVPPLRVLRRELGAPPVSAWLLILCSLLAMALLIVWQAGEPALAGWVLAGAAGTLLSLWLVARLLLRLLRPLRHRGGTRWRQGLAGLLRDPAMTTLQLMGFGIGILALVLLATVRLDLLNAWQRTVPATAPNHFLINIQPADVPALTDFLRQHNLNAEAIYPMLRARLVRINQRTVSPEQYADDRAQRLVAREFNLSWSSQPPYQNQISAGRWWSLSETQTAQFSVEQGLANTLGIRLGDQLTFDMAGEPVVAQVTSLRVVRWDTFQPNFFVIGTPGLLDSLPASHITSFYLPPGEERTLVELIRGFPSITLIDVSALLQQVRDIMARGSQAVEYVFLFTLLAGTLMLYAGVQASREHRLQNALILRTLGMPRRGLIGAAAIEFGLLGLLAGTLATLCANLAGWLIATEVFGFEYAANWPLIVTGVLGSGLVIALAGLAVSWPLTIRPPLRMLQARG